MKSFNTDVDRKVELGHRFVLAIFEDHKTEDKNNNNIFG